MKKKYIVAGGWMFNTWFEVFDDIEHAKERFEEAKKDNKARNMEENLYLAEVIEADITSLKERNRAYNI